MLSSTKIGRLLFPALAILSLTPWSTPPRALLAGMAVGLAGLYPYSQPSKKVSGWLLRSCVVLLGFGMNLGVVLAVGARGAGLAALTIGSTMLVGTLLGKWLRVPARTSLLINAGTAICGGSAIAAIGTVTEAEEGEMTVALSTVFLLNAVALYAFPPLGHRLHLSEEAFGGWAGIAIHDVSSVVGAASAYGPTALGVATAVKLSRALWIAPLTLLVARIYQKRGVGAAGFPWFIVAFVLASAVRSAVPGMASVAPAISSAARAGLGLTLFLIGSSLSIRTVRQVGWRALAQGLILWLFISSSSLLVLSSRIV